MNIQKIYKKTSGMIDNRLNYLQHCTAANVIFGTNRNFVVVVRNQKLCMVIHSVCFFIHCDTIRNDAIIEKTFIVTTKNQE